MKPYNEEKYIACARGVKFHIYKTEQGSVFSINKYNDIKNEPSYIIYDNFIEWVYENINNFVHDEYFEISRISTFSTNLYYKG